MVKKVVSFTLSENVTEKIDQTSKALGMSRSEYVEKMLSKGFHFNDEIKESVDKIKELQEKVKDQIKVTGG